MNTILTLCPRCAEDYRTAGFRVKQVTRTTTERKKGCEGCGQKGNGFDQWHVQGGRK